MKVCEGCELEIAEGEDGRIWCDGPLGMSALVVHRTQACGKAALEARPELKMRAGNRPPLTKAEKAKAEMGAA